METLRMHYLPALSAVEKFGVQIWENTQLQLDGK